MKTISFLMLMVFVVAVGVSSGGPLCRMLVQHPELDGDLEITADQRVQLEDLYEDTEKDIIEAKADLEIKRMEMERLMRSEDPDMREIRKLVNEIGDARSALMMAGIEREVRTKRILGREQVKRARHAVTRMERGRRAAAGLGDWRSRRPGMRPEGPGEAGRGCMRYHGRMMDGSGGRAHGEKGCGGHMMQGTQGMGGEHKGCKGHMMKGSGGGAHGEKGCRGHMMQSQEDPDKQPKSPESN